MRRRRRTVDRADSEFSPQPQWDRIPVGYEKGDGLVLVKEARQSNWDESEYGPGPGYDVDIVYGSHPNEEQLDVVTVTDRETAWGVANLLTYYAEERSGIESVRHDYYSDRLGQFELLNVVEEKSAADIVRDLAGRRGDWIEAVIAVSRYR